MSNIVVFKSKIAVQNIFYYLSLNRLK